MFSGKNDNDSREIMGVDSFDDQTCQQAKLESKTTDTDTALHI